MALDGYVITLSRRPDRIQAFRENTKRTGLEIETFTAIDGRTLDTLPFLGRLNPWFHEFGNDGLIRGVIGCKLSHEAVWDRIAGHADGLYFVFEDDARLRHPRFPGRVRDAARSAPRDADLVWLNDFDPTDRIRLWPRFRNRLDQASLDVRLGSKVQWAFEASQLATGVSSFKRWPHVSYKTCEAYMIRPAYAAALLAYTRTWVDSIDAQVRSAVENLGSSSYTIHPTLFHQDADVRTDIQLQAVNSDDVKPDCGNK